MGEAVYVDHFDREVILADEVRAVILVKHPEIEPFIDSLANALSHPVEIRRSITDSRAVLYYYFAEDAPGGKWIVVVVKQIDRNFISTIYLTDRIKAGEIIWKK